MITTINTDLDYLLKYDAILWEEKWVVLGPTTHLSSTEVTLNEEPLAPPT